MTGSLSGRGEAVTEPLPDGDLLTAPVLTAALRALSNNGLVLKGYHAHVLHPSRSRPVLRYALTYSANGKKDFVRKVMIGKAYYRGDGAMAFHVMGQLWSDGFAQDRLTIPEPLVYMPELRLLLQGQALGKALYLDLDNPATARERVRLTARWLAKLHRARVTGAPVLRPEQEEAKLSAFRDVLRTSCALFAPRIEDLARRIVSHLKALGPQPLVPTHGDFQPKNIYTFRNRVTVIDFDRFALAHPARDLGHFIGQCLTMSYVRTGSFAEIEPWNSAFLDEYVSLTSPGVLPALPVFIARTFLEVLSYKLLLAVKAAPLVPAWLDECERCLERVPSSGGIARAESVGLRPAVGRE